MVARITSSTTAELPLWSSMWAAKGLSITSSGGTLVGTWYADSSVISSDRRLKRDIEPLRETLSRLHTAIGTNDVANEDVSSWLIDQLRPVSYVYKSSPKGSRRFGFLADELQGLLPDIVHEADDEERTKGVHLLDLIAVIVAAAQRIQRHERLRSDMLEQHDGRIATLEKELKDEKRRNSLLEIVSLDLSMQQLSYCRGRLFKFKLCAP